MLNAGELLIAILAIVALFETLYLRKELEEHGLKIWVYVAFPLMAATTLILAMWHELPLNLAESLSYILGALTVVAFFIGTLIAYWRR